MEECPICLDPMMDDKKYTLNCNHSMCNKCAKISKKQSNENCINIETTFKVYTKEDNPIKCPLCRCVEKKMTVDEFKEYDEDTYNMWMELELNCDEYGWSTCDPKPTQMVTTYIPRKYESIPKRVFKKVRAKSFKHYTSLK